MGAASANDTTDILTNQSYDALAIESEDVLSSQPENPDEVQATESEDVLSDDVKPFSEIQALIDNASAGDTVKISGTYKSSGKIVSINKAITLEGVGYTLLQGYDSWDSLRIYTNGVTVKNINFLKGGNGISCDHYVCNVVNCTFRELTDSAFYGAGNIHNCTFDNNKGGDGGAIRFAGLSGEYIVSDCIFTNNRATAGPGGAIYVLGKCMRMKNCYFKNNVARDGGNDIYNGIIYECEFADYSEKSLRNCYVYDIAVSQSGSHYQSKTVAVKVVCIVVNENFESQILNYNKSVSGAEVTLKFSNGKTAKIKTDENGTATYDVPFHPGTYGVVATYATMDKSLSGIKIVNAPATLSAAKLTTTYASGKYFTVKVIGSTTKKPISGVKLLLKVYTGKKYKKVYITTDSKGIAKYNTGGLGLGKHKIVVSASNAVTAKAITSQVKINKAKRYIVASKTTVAYKKAGKFVVTVKHKESKKPLKGVKLTIKVFTGKKYKTYTVKTNKKGQASISTKKLSKATHKVSIKIKASSKYYATSRSSKIIVKNKLPASAKTNDDNLLKEPKETHIREGIVRMNIYITGLYAGFEGDYAVYDKDGNMVKDAIIRIYVDGVYKKNMTSGSHVQIYCGENSVVDLVYEGNIYYNGCVLRYE